MFLFVFSPIAAGAWKREMYMCLEGEGWAFTIQCIVSDLFFTIFCFNKPFSRLRLAKKCSIKFKEKKGRILGLINAV